MKYILQLKQVQHSYNGRPVLSIPELNITPGSITGLAGPNGSGKSTLLKILSLAEKCSSGTVCFEGREAVPSTRQTRHKITMLPQKPYLLKRSVYENIAYGLRIREEKNDLNASVSMALDLVGLHESFGKRQWHELSGGEAHRVALAARLALKPACLLLDEPTVSVDMESARNIRQAILMAKKEWGTTLVIASHHRSWLNDICDRIIYLYNGRILDTSFENVLLGPWVQLKNNQFGKTLADGQEIFVSRPPYPDAGSVIDPKHLKVSTATLKKNENSLIGTVTGIFIDNHYSGPRVHVTCGDHSFIASIDNDIFSMGNCRPGKKVTLIYRSENITWLPR